MATSYEKPSPALTRELERVAELSAALVAHTHRTNVPLPPGFPMEQIEAICTELVKLPHGTQEGCLTSLVYARRRLAATRREFIATVAPTELAETPTPLRGEPLDQFMGNLEAAIGPAIDQYQVDAGKDLQETADLEAPVRKDSIPGLAEARTGAKSLAQKIGTAAAEIESFNELNSVPVETLQRRLTDTEIQSALAAAELGMPAIRGGWFRAVVRQLRKMPSTLQAAGRAIQVATHISEPLIDRWNDFQKNSWNHLLHEVSQTGKALEEFGSRLKEPRVGGPSGSSELSVPQVASPKEFDAERATAIIRAGLELPTSWVPAMTSLELESVGSLANLAQLVHLQSLTIDNGPVAGATDSEEPVTFPAVSKLIKLKKLVLRGVLVTPSMLEPLQDLQWLDLHGSMLGKFRQPYRLPALRFLNLSNTDLADPRWFIELKTLEALDLGDTYLRRIDSLDRLEKLRALALTGLQLWDFAQVKLLTQITHLDVSNSGLDTVRHLASLPQLRILSVDETPVSNLQPLSELPNLALLSIVDTDVTSLKPLLRTQSEIWVGKSGKGLGLLKKYPRGGRTKFAPSRATAMFPPKAFWNSRP